MNNKTFKVDPHIAEAADATLVQETLEATSTRFEKLINGLGKTFMLQGPNLVGAGMEARPPKFGTGSEVVSVEALVTMMKMCFDGQ